MGGEIEILQERSDTYARLDVSYRNIRHEFLDTCKWGHILDHEEDVGQSRIPFRVEAAHRGDAVADSFLYTTGDDRRDDARMMVLVYGFLPDTILELNSRKDHRTIGELNKHASLFLKFNNAMPDGVRRAFNDFCNAVESMLREESGKHPSYWVEALNRFEREVEALKI
ncbi:hypothetical protein FQN54_008108 [Arachnomyces sp. PD_36]|nr:hypothetical protein FQN54_008108 [Arachnomyces sp. PD_36]